MKMKLAEVAKALNVDNDITTWQDVEITSVAFDSRKIKPGALFVPLMGAQDGHQFVDSAFQHGAVASLWGSDHDSGGIEQPILIVRDPLKALQELGQYYLQKINPVVVAVTGSNGKTTTKDMIAAVLGMQMNVTKTFENFNNQIGVPVTLLNMEPNTEAVVVEMGMDHFGELDFLSKMVSPDFAVITMIGEAHIEFFGTRDRIADAKMEIVNGLKEDGTLVFNGDEPLLVERAAQIDRQLVKFGRQIGNDVYATSVRAGSDSLSFTTNKWPEVEFKIPMIGEYNVNNALGALGVGELLHISPQNMQTALATVNITRNRAQWVTGATGSRILSDVYNSNPTAVKEVLKVFENADTHGRRIAVLGDMLELGEASDSFHAELAESLDPAKISEVYLIGQHMRELDAALADRYGTHVHYYPLSAHEQLNADLKNDISGDDIVLLKGSHGIHLETTLADLLPK